MLVPPAAHYISCPLQPYLLYIFWGSFETLCQKLWLIIFFSKFNIVFKFTTWKIYLASPINRLHSIWHARLLRHSLSLSQSLAGMQLGTLPMWPAAQEQEATSTVSSSLDLPLGSQEGSCIFIGMHWELGPQGLGLQALDDFLLPRGLLVTMRGFLVTIK